MIQPKERIYFENLDALRFLAALAVMGEHITRSFYFPADPLKKYFIIAISLDGSGGEWGVTFFFVLSGFLITHLLLQEIQQAGRFHLATFYIRRTLRIWPLYFVVLIFGFVLHPWLDASLSEKANPALYSLFLANFDNIYGAWPQSGILGVQWSLAIEEQFYLLWPLLILILIPRKRFFLIFIGGLILSSFLFRLSGGHKYHTLSGVAPLMMGAALAYVSIYQKSQLDRWLRFFTRQRMMGLYICFFILIFLNYRLSRFFHLGDIISVFAFPLMSVIILIDQAFSPHTLFQLSNWKWASIGGKMSYGIYLLHMVTIMLSLYAYQEYHLSFWLAMVMVVVLTVLLVVMSHYFIEKPFLKMKSLLKS